MKDSLTDLFSERFQSHEAPVDPATWQVIEARLLTSAPATDQVNELFRERFEQHEVSVDPGVWQGISSQLGHGAAAGSGLLGGFGWVAAGVAGIVVAGGLYYFTAGSATVPSTVQPAEHANTVVLAEPGPGSETVISTDALPAAPQTEARQEPQAPATPTQRGEQGPLQTRPHSQPPVVLADNTDEAETTEGPLDTSGAPIVREIIAAMTSAAERELQRSLQAPAGTNTTSPVATSNEAVGHNEDPSAFENGLAEQTEPCTLFLENIFTPNNDGVNDSYVVKAPPCITSASIRIFSMSGQLVYVMNNYEPWTGANSDEGWYIVVGEARTVEGSMIPVKGTVYLKRSGNN